jgi:hypothetical protein
MNPGHWFISLLCLWLLHGRLTAATFNFENFDSSIDNLGFCSVNATINYADVFELLVNESRAFIDMIKNAGGIAALFSTGGTNGNTEYPPGIPEILFSSPVWDALECCQHPTAPIPILYNYGCPKDVSLCVFDPRVDNRRDNVAVYRPAGCCPLEAPHACFPKQTGGGLEGCCPAHKSKCCHNAFTQEYIGCAEESHQCCMDKICPAGYVCCKGRTGLGGTTCCPRYGGSCYNQDFFAHGLGQNVSFGPNYNDTEGAVKLSAYFGLVYGQDGCIPAPGGEHGPVKKILYISNSSRQFDFNKCRDGSNRTKQLVRHRLRRVATREEDIGEDGYPLYTFDAINLTALGLNINQEAQRFGGIGDLNFTKCGHHLCYGERDYCVYRYENETIKVNFRVINVTEIVTEYFLVLDIANSNLTDDIEPPPPLDYVRLEQLEVRCGGYNNTYLQKLIDDKIYEPILYGGHVSSQFHYLLPMECLIYNHEYFIRSHPLGCCPVNSTPCAAFEHTLKLPLPSEYPKYHSIYDPMLGCALEGEICCGNAICTAGYKCCDIRLTVDGGFAPITLDGESNLNGHVTGTYLRMGLLYDLLNNADAFNRTYNTDILDLREKCCPVYSFCCQIETGIETVKTTGKLMHYYCSVDPFCKIPISNGGSFSGAAGIKMKIKGYPAQMLSEDLSLDHNSDGIYDFVQDILETNRYKNTIYAKSSSPSDIGKYQCNISLDNVNIIECSKLNNNPRPPVVGVTPNTRRHYSPLDDYPPPPEKTPIVVFNILGISFEVDTTNIFSIESPLRHYFLQFRDYSEQLILEAYYGKTFIDFPPP